MARIGYVGVSTSEQNTERQEVLIQEMGVEKIFIDKASEKNTKGKLIIWNISTINYLLIWNIFFIFRKNIP